MPFVNPGKRWWRRCLGDLQIMTRMLHEVATAMLRQNHIDLFKSLHDLQVYAERLKSELRKDEEV